MLTSYAEARIRFMEHKSFIIKTKSFKIIIRLRPSVSGFINYFVDFLLILIDLKFFLISAALGIAQANLALLSLARDFYAEGV